MLSYIRPLLNEEVRHWLPPTRDLFGKETDAGSTKHPARVIDIEGEVVSALSRDNLPDAKAIIWLLDHPRPVIVGDTFELPGGTMLKVIRAERRTHGGSSLTKAYLS